MLSVFDYKSYKAFLLAALSRTETPEISRSKLAKAIGCAPAFVSQVLNQHSHFSLEHGPLITDFLNLTNQEGRYFMLLLQHGRAGTEKLRAFFSQQSEELRKRQNEIKTRVAVAQEISESQKALYYSSWHYAAVHVLISIRAFSKNPDEIARRLKLSRSKVEEILNALTELGLIKRTSKGFRMTSNRIHVPSDSPHVLRHHANWRLQAIESINEHFEDGLHFSSVLAVSKSDVEAIKSVLLKTIESAESIIRRSPEEEIACLNIDMFSLRK